MSQPAPPSERGKPDEAKPSAPAARPLPKPPSTARDRCAFNLCGCRKGDTIVFGAEWPGQTRPDPSAALTPRGPLVGSAVVDAWCIFMESQGIRRVLCLLTPAELGFYSDDLLARYAGHFPPIADGGESRVMSAPPGEEGAYGKIMHFLRAAERAAEPLVVHCSTGQGRTAHVLALWAHERHALELPAAVAEVGAWAAERGATRKASVEGALELLLGPSAARAMPSMRALAAPMATPRVQDKLHITFVQVGRWVLAGLSDRGRGVRPDVVSPRSPARSTPPRLRASHWPV